MSIATVITEGFGSFGDVAHVVTDGFDIGAASLTPADATILTQAFGALTAASAFVVTEGFRSGTPTPTPTPTPTGQVGTGGDDVPRRRRKSPHRGFDLEAWRAKQPDFEATVRKAYDALMRGPDAAEADEVVSAHRGSAGIDWPAVYRDDGALKQLLELREREEEEIIVMLLH